MTSEEIRRRFLAFFEKRGHTIIPSASLVPENDPSVLFTTAGMHPLVPYILGEKHPGGNRVANVQKCVRTQDIDEVGDKTHDTFFEMLGNWSFGDYFKKEAIGWSYEFLTDKKEGLGLDPGRLYITCFEGDENAPKDEESAKTWESLGIPKNRIYFLGADKNWWSPGPNGPCGPDTEMFYDVTEKGLGDLSKEEFLQADKDQQIVEIWNDVFMEYEKKDGKVVGKLKQHNVDTGAGLERLAMVMQKKDNIFDTDLFAPVMQEINKLSQSDDIRAKRIIADHIRTAVFMIADGVSPSNTDRGYVLRRLLRRAVRYSGLLKMKSGSPFEIAETVIQKYADVYTSIKTSSEEIKREVSREEDVFKKTLEEGLKEFNRLTNNISSINGNPIENVKELNGVPINKIKTINGVPLRKNLSGMGAFTLYSSYGFPIEMIIELGKEKGVEINGDIELSLRKTLDDKLVTEKELDIDEFNNELKKHQELSRKGAEQKFKGGLADHSEMSVKYHTATHLLHQALREVLGKDVFQKGSNITPERLRFDFSFGRKMTDEEKKKTEDLVNEKIKESLTVSYEDIPLEEAQKKGAIGLFEEKYGDKVRIYKVGDFSLEFCGGPHVKNTNELGAFKIQKEEALSAGVRRIRAVLG